MHDTYGVNYARAITPIKSNSFFLFGARGTGKSTFLRRFFDSRDRVLWIDLLHASTADRYGRNPDELISEVRGANAAWDFVVIDEVQKVPKLLDAVHLLIEECKQRFALTGSSVRKLRHGGANLLAGRAFMNHLFPLTHVELGNDFDLAHTLRFGSLPQVVMTKPIEEKNEFLRSYALSFLNEEVWAEHIVRKLDPFRKFLEVAAQCNGEPINYSNIGKDVGAETKTVQSYYQILEDTLLGFHLEAFHGSIRKRQRQAPKFYLFDLGVQRALSRVLNSEPTPATTMYGKGFEHLVIAEAHRLNDYYKKDFRFSYLRTKDQVEIDLIVERPGAPVALIEIKSTDHVDERHVARLKKISKQFKHAESFCLSTDPIPKVLDGVSALPWQTGLREIGL